MDLTMACLKAQLIAGSPTSSAKNNTEAAEHLKGCRPCRDILRHDRVPFSHLVPEEKRREELASDTGTP